MIYIILLLSYLSINLSILTISLIIIQLYYKYKYMKQRKINKIKYYESLKYIKEHHSKVCKDLNKFNECFRNIQELIDKF